MFESRVFNMGEGQEERNYIIQLEAEEDEVLVGVSSASRDWHLIRRMVGGSNERTNAWGKRVNGSGEPSRRPHNRVTRPQPKYKIFSNFDRHRLLLHLPTTADFSDQQVMKVAIDGTTDRIRVQVLCK